MTRKKEDNDPFKEWLEFQWWISLHIKYGFPLDFLSKLEEQFREWKEWTNYQSIDETTLPTYEKDDIYPTEECICPCCKNQRDITYLNRDSDDIDIPETPSQTPEEETHSAIDLIDWGNTITITIEIPSDVLKKDIKIDTAESEITIKVDKNKHRFYRRIQLPHKVDVDSVKTSYQNGVLDIELKKTVKNKKNRNKEKIHKKE